MRITDLQRMRSWQRDWTQGMVKRVHAKVFDHVEVNLKTDVSQPTTTISSCLISVWY